MSESNIFINTNYIQNKNVESEIFENFSKEKFYNDLERLGVNLENIDKKSADKEVFNWVLRKLKSSYGYSILECILYLEKDHLSLKKLLALIDEEVFQIIKIELAEKYNIKILKTKLEKFLYVN